MSFTIESSTASRGYTQDQGQRAATVWVEASAAVAGPVKWNDHLHHRVTGAAAQPVRVVSWHTTNGSFEDLFEILMLHPLEEETSERLKRNGSWLRVPGLGFRLVRLDRSGTNAGRSFGMFIAPSAIYVFNPWFGLLRFPRLGGSTDVPAYLKKTFPEYAHGTATIDVVLPDVELVERTPPADWVPDQGWVNWAVSRLQTGHLVLGEVHGSLPAKRLLLAILNHPIGSQVVSGVFLESGTSDKKLRLDYSDLPLTMFGYWGMNKYGLGALDDDDNPLALLVRQIRARAEHLGTPFWGIDPFRIYDDKNATQPFLVGGIRLERYRGSEKDPLKARVTSEGLEVRNRNWARVFSDKAGRSGGIMICGASHVRPGSSGDEVRSRHEFVQYLAGIQTALTLVPN